MLFQGQIIISSPICSDAGVANLCGREISHFVSMLRVGMLFQGQIIVTSLICSSGVANLCVPEF